METFAPPKDFVENPRFESQRRRSLARLDIDKIDAPIAGIVGGLAEIPYCFTLQSCCGHFVHDGQREPHNLGRLPDIGDITSVEYRIAYIALCLENSPAGRDLLTEMKRIPEIDPEYIQLGSAGWFWKNRVNTFALQVEPERFKHLDKARVGLPEARHIEKVRDLFLNALEELVAKLPRNIE